MGHEIKAIKDPNGWKAVCVCGTFTLGYFPSEAAAKRAGMNTSHADNKPRVEFVEVKG